MTGQELPVVSVVIPTHGRGGLRERAVTSAVGQDYAGVVETVIVHDHEEVDASAESNDPRRPVRVISNDRARGISGARNCGILASSGAVIATLDDDDYWLPQKISAQVDALLAEPDLLLVGSAVFLHTPNGNLVTRQPAKTTITHRELLHGPVRELEPSTALMRRSAFDIAGLYDEEMRGIEHYEWTLRLASHGPVRVVPEAGTHIFRDRALWLAPRWRRIAGAREQLLERHPDITADPQTAGLIYAKLAFAHAGGENRVVALRWAAKAIRNRPVNPWAGVAVLVAVVRLPVRWVQWLAGRLGKSI